MKKPTYITVICFLIILLISGQVISQTYKPFTARKQTNVKGSMVVIGNSILGQDNFAFNDLSKDNQDIDMQYIDIDTDNSTFCSSSADLILQPQEDGSPTTCYRVAYAGLYWGAVLQSGDRSSITNVKFKLPGNSDYNDINGELIYDAIVDPIVSEPGEAGNTPYACFAEVTDLMSTLTDIEGTYTMANINSSLGFNNSTGISAGWSLVVIYEDPNLHTKSFTTYDGFSHIFDGHQETVPVTGFTTPQAGPIDLQFAYGTLDGDRTKRATKLEINGKEVTTPLRSANKFFGSVIENYNGISHPRNPFSQNTLGYDTGMLEVFNAEPEFIRNGDTSADFRLQVARGQADPIFAFFTAFAVDIIAPDINLTKIVLDDNGNNIDGDNVVLGQTVFYEITYQNVGNDNVTNFTITDILPDNIIFDPDTDIDLTNAGGATLLSYDPGTRTIVFSVPDTSVEINDPEFVIRLRVQVVPNCYDLAQACSNEILNQAFATYQGVINTTVIQEEGSFASVECLGEPGPTNFIVDISNCNFENTEILCGNSVILTAASGYDSYTWSSSPTGIPVIGTSQIYTATETGTYYVTGNTTANCLSIDEIFNVIVYGSDLTNPVIPFADEVVICPNDGKELPLIFLCGANDEREILTGISDAVSIIWQQLDETSCPEIAIEDCANENDTCTWNQVGAGPDYIVNTAGQFRLVVNYPGGCFNIFYFNVFTNLLEPTVTSNDILCTTPGQIIVGGVPSGYEYSLNTSGPWQTSNVFSVSTPGFYTVYIRQIGVTTNPCIFETPEVFIRLRDFNVTSTIIQPVCYDDKGTIILAVNDALPQYYYSIYEGTTLVNSIGPTSDSDYTFANLNPGVYTVEVSTDDGCLHTEDIEIFQPNELSVTAALTIPLTCIDGEITIYPQGGTPPYTYFINSTTISQDIPIYTVTDPGIYDITVYDFNSCSATTSITVDAALPPDFTVDTSDILCPGETNGSITVNVINANGNVLQYSIDNGVTFSNSPIFSGLSAGNYDVVVNYSFGGNACQTIAQPVIISENPPIVASAELSATLTCTTGGLITITSVTGGTAPYTYSIDGVNFQSGNSFSGLDAGTYTISIQDDNDCTSITNQITIAPVNPPTDLEFSHTPIDCATNTTTISITNTIGGTGTLEYQIIAPALAATAYQTSNSFSGLEPGTYVFQVRDENNCAYSESYTVVPLPTTTVNVVLSEGLDCTATPDAVIDGTINGTAPFTYAVSFNGGTFSTLGSTGSAFSYSTNTAGDYQFEITDGNGCSVLSQIISVNPITPPSIISVVEGQSINCNGDSTGVLDITIDTTVGTAPFAITVVNTSTGTNYGSQTTSLPAGDYTVTITDANSCTDTQMVTITEPDAINVNFSTIDISCTASGVSQGSVIIDAVTGGTAPYNYFVTGTNGYSNSELNATGSTSVAFNVVDFGLYEINVVDANGCSVLVQDVLVASPPDDLDIAINATTDCITGGQVEVTVSTTLASSGPFFFAIYDGTIPAPPAPAPALPGGPWQAESTPGSGGTIFTGLTTGIVYTLIVYDEATGCTYFESATAPIPTNATITATAVSSNNITCTGSNDGNVSFTITNPETNAVTISYEVFNALSLVSTGITGTGSVPALGNLNISNLGSLAFGNYFVSITETSGPNAGCGIVTTPFNITESAFPLDLNVSMNQNANCNANSGVISAVGQNGTAPYLYQATTTAAAPLATDAGWVTSGTFNLDANTYYIHVLDAFGCIVSSTATLLPMDDNPVISASINNDCVAVDGTFQIDVDLISPGIAPYSVSIDGGVFQTQSFPFTISNLAAGNHTVEITDANGCGNLVSLDILPVLEFSPSVTAFPTCNNDDGEIMLAPTGGSGSYTYTILPSASSVNISGNTITGVPFGLYDITITDTVTGCIDTVSVNLPEAIAPIFTLTPTSVTCFTDNDGTFAIDITNYSGAYTYEVLDNTNASIFGVVSANTSTNPLTVSGLTSGTYSVTITQTDNPFCSSTSEVIINSPSAVLMLNVTETSDVSCTNNDGTITATANGGWGNYEYELTGDATVAYSPNGTFTDLSAGNYTVNVRDAQGCIVSETIVLIEPTPITATFTPSTNMLSCFGDDNASITITNVTGGQGNNYIYTLNKLAPVVTTSGPQTSNVFNNLASGTYSVTVTDGLNCTITSLDIVIDEPTPIQASLVKASSQTCFTESTLTLSASGGTGLYSYSTDSAFSTVIGTFTNSTTFNVPVGTYSYFVRDENNCIAEVSNEITIDPLQDLIIELASTNPTINCAGDNSGSITATAFGGLGNYVYSLEDTAGNTINATQNSPGYFTELTAGNYVVSVESGDCSETTSTITITEPNTILEASINITNVTCAGTNDGAIEVLATGGTGPIKYAISPQLNQFFDTNIFENLAPGEYQIIVQDELGCYLTFSETVTEPEQVILSLVPNSILPEVCDSDLNGEFSIELSGGTLPYSVSLDDYDGFYTTGSLTQIQFDFTNLNGGDHIVFVRDAEGCETEWNITFPESVLINPQLEINYNCEQNEQINSVTVLVDESIDDISELDFSLNGGPYQASPIFTNIPVRGDNYITVRHTNGCEQTTELFDMLDYEPVTLVLTDGEELNQIIANASGGTGDFTFTFNDENYNQENTYTIGYSGVFTVTVTDANGCSAVAQIEREFIEICIPNYFTPNGDGTTDTWAPGCIGNYPNLEFDIFDRYGRKVATYRAGEYWDGRYNGTELPTGDYWYVVRPNDDTVTRHFVGHFTLYR